MPKKLKLKTNGGENEELQTETSDDSGLSKNGQNLNGVFSSYVHSNDPEEVMKQIFSEDNKIYINKLKLLSITELTMIAEHLKIENYESMHTQEMVYQILRKHADNEGIIYGGGTLQVIEGGFGFLRSQRYNFLPSSDDIYVSPSQISLFKLRTGDTLEGQIRPPKRTEEEKFFALLRIEKINDKSPEESRKRTLFDNLTPLFPDEHLHLEVGSDEIAMRIMDIFTPIGKGQRGLIVSPPKAGKTVLLKKIANSITSNHEEVRLIIFLVDERPEEVTDMQRSVDAEVLSSTFDEPATKHVLVAQMVLEKAKRLVESGYDVVILLDSITRLARAYNQVEPTSGKVLSGGIDSNALHKPKKFFGAARNIEEGGSLTIIATALVDTGSKMDEVIYEEFKGTGNMEIHLDRNLSNIRVFPAIDIKLSGTRREDLLMESGALEKVRILRKVFASMQNEEIIAKLTAAMKKTITNSEFLNNLQYFSNS
jgi:transcription termination factor Rho